MNRKIWKMNKCMVYCLVLIYPFAYSYAKYEAFDFCGLDNFPCDTNPFYDMVMECVPCSNNWTRFDVCRAYGVSTSNAIARAEMGDDRFYSVAVEAEFAWVQCREVRMRRCFSLLGRMLKMEDEYCDVLGTFNSRRCHNRICYMLARMVNYRGGDRPQITSEDIDAVFPPIDISPDAKRIRLRQETFRRMLKVGVEIEKFLKKEGRLPTRLNEVGPLSPQCLKDAYGNSIEYVQQEMIWKLYARCDSGLDDFQSINAIIPSVESAWGLSRGLWFSSAYSIDRCLLYRSKVLKIDDGHLEIKWSVHGDRLKVE